MSGLELVVRPVVLPDTRPTPQPVRPAGDADDKLATIAGSGGGLVDLPQSFSGSWNKQRSHETKRVFDQIRIYNEEDPDQYIDYEAVTKLHKRHAGRGTSQEKYPRVQEQPGRVEIIRRDWVRQVKPIEQPNYGDDAGGGGAP